MRRCISFLVFSWLALSIGDVRAQQSCNPVVCENQLPGNPSSEWDVSGSGDSTIQGFATDISVNIGDTVNFKVNTSAASFRISIYRLGYYGGNGARQIGTLGPFTGVSQPACLTASSTGLVDCGNWSVAASWAVPSTAVSGVYLARLSRVDNGGASHIVFVVRDDARHADVLFQTSDTTWQAYNTFGGNSLYVGGPGANPGRAYKVSYNRPFTTRGSGPEDWLFNAEYPMIRFLEANGYDVSYFTGVDTDRYGATELFRHRVFVSVGHDEYWSGPQRANVEAARNGGVNLAFFSGNEMFWKTRWESSIDGSGTPYRTLVSYKETHANATIDPQDPPTWTGTWRDPRFSPPADGGRPENAVTGTIFTVNCCSTSAAIRVTQTYSSQPFWRNTRVATLPSGGSTTLTAGTLGYEWDENLNNGFRPAGLTPLSSTTVSVSQKLQDYGSTYASGSATHQLTLYRHLSGALVFGAGTVQYSWGLDGNHDRGGSTPDVALQQATVNLFADMGVAPGSLQSGLVSGTPDTTAPSVSLTAPVAGATVSGGVTVTASASDNVGVAGVQFQLDGTSLGSEVTSAPFTLVWDSTSSSNGSHTLTAVARDAAGNRTTSAAVTVTVSNAITTSLSVDTSVFGDRSTAGTTIATSAFSTAATNELLLAFVAADDASVGGQRVTAVSGASLTWQMVVRTNAQRGTSEIWRAFASAKLTNVVVTATLAQSAAASITVMAIKGADPTTPIGATGSANAASGAPAASLVTTRPASLVVGVGNDWDTATSRTIGPSQTMVHQYLASVGDTFWTQRTAATIAGAGTTVTINDTAPTGDRYNLSICEVLSAQTTSDPTPPTVSLTSPAGGTTVSGSIAVSASASDNVGIVGVQFMLDGANLGAEVSTAPYGVTWDTTQSANGSHTVVATARDAAGNVATSTAVVTVSNVDSVPPTVSMTSPASNATVSGSSVAVSATAGDNIGVAGVQFKLDGANLGAEDSTSPYGVVWNTTTASNGSHTLSATARDNAGNLTTASVTVNVSNVTASNLTVNGATKFQAIDGFGVNLNPKLWNNGELIGGINQLIDVMGVNIVRVDVLTNSWWELGNDDGDAQNYNWAYYNRLFDSTNFRDVWNTIEYLNRRRVTVIFSAAGLLPAWMGGATLNTAQEDEFAEMYVAALYYARVTKGLTVSLIDPMNEVDKGSPEGPSLSSAQYARVLRKIADRLTALGLSDVKIVPPEVANVGATDYFAAVMADSVLASRVDIAGFHSYSGNTPSLSALSGRRLWMTEWSNGSTDGFLDGGKSVANEWTFARAEADYLLNHLRDGASAALKWDAIDNVHEHDPSGAVTKWGSLAYDFTTHTMTPRKRLYTAGIVFRFVQPGMSRVSTSTTTGVTVYGFYDSASGKVTLVGHNTSGSPVVLNGSLSNVGTVTTLNSYTTDSASANITRGADVTVSGGAFSYSVPADTFFALSSGTLPQPLDTQAPAVTFTAPTGGGSVSGLVGVVADATDDQAVSAVQFSVDGQLFDVAVDAPYATSIDTQFLANGNHIVTATAWDAASHSTSVTMALNVNNAATKSLVAAYGFNENAGLAAGDSAGTSGAGFLNGAGWTPSGKFGAGVTFSGQSLVVVNDSPYLHLGSGLTLEAWVKPSSTSGNQAILFKEWTGVPSWSLYSASGTLQGQVTNSLMTTTSLDGTGAVPSNTWTHVAMTYDGTSARFYVNGALTATRSASAPFVTNNPLYIGGNVFHGDYFAGTIDEVRIYNRALASTEIQADMTLAVDADTTPPTVTLTTPVSGDIVSGVSVAIAADAADNKGVAGVRFTVDGNNIGAEDLVSPYSVNWDSTSVSNGTHTLGAIARDMSGNTTTATINVTVTNPPIISGVTVNPITATSATVAWTTNAPASSQVSYGTTPAYGSSTALDSSLTTSHSQTLTGLTSATTYHFQVVSTDANSMTAMSPDATFATLDNVPPDVSITVPADGATVSGTTVTVSATASDNVGVAGVQFKLDGSNLGAEDTAGPYSVSWNTTTASNGIHNLSAVARDAAGNSTPATAVSVTVANPPVISGVTVNPITSTSATIGWTTNMPANSQINYGLTASYGASTPLDPVQTTTHSQQITGLTASTTYHYQIVSTDSLGNTGVTQDGVFITANAPDTVFPTVSISTPAAGATVSGSAVTVSANAADNVGVVGVQFKLDGSNLGSEDTTAPYSVSWNTTTVANGTHNLTAVARDAAGNATTSAPVTVTVSNAQQPLAIDGASWGDQGSTSVKTVTASVTTAGANELLLAFIAADDVSAGNTVSGVSGGGLTWQLVARANGRRGVSEVWRAWAAAKLTSTAVTATLVQGAASSMTVVSFTGADSTGTNGSGAIGATRTVSSTGAPSGTVTTTRANSWVFGVGNDWDHATQRTLGPSQTMVHQYLAPVGDTYWVQRMTAPTPAAGTNVTINDTAPTGDQFNLVVVEVMGK